MRTDEIYNETPDIFTVCCANEAVYKLYSEQHLTYQEMKVDVINKRLLNLKTNTWIEFTQSIYSDYILVTCWINK